MRRIHAMGLLALGTFGVLAAESSAAGLRDDGEPPLIVLHDGVNPLAPRALVLEDATGELRFDDVRDSRRHPFGPLAMLGDSPGHSRSVYWLQFRVRNDTASSSFIIELAMTPEIADLYDTKGAVSRSGMALPFGQRSVAHARVAFRVALSAGEEKTLWIRQRSNDRIWLTPKMWSEGAFWESRSNDWLLHGFCYGVLIGLALYNLFLFLATRDRSYLLYVVFQVTNGLTLATFDKYTFQYFWPDHPGWAARSEAVFEFLALAAGIAFARAFLETRRQSPRLDRALRGLWIAGLVLAGIWIVADLEVLQRLARPSAVRSGIIVLEMTGCAHAVASILAVSVAAAIAAARPGATNARVFVIAWTGLLAGAVVSALSVAGVVSTDGSLMLRIGSALEAVLMSLALAARLNRLTREREQAQRQVLVANAARLEGLRQLVSGVAHEVGNPLNFACGGADELAAQIDTLADRAPDAAAPARRAHHLVASGLGRIRSIVDNLRQYLSVGDAAAVPTDLAQEIEQALALSAARLATCGVRVEKHIEVLPIVRARPGELHQVLLNLIGNALEAMPAGGTLRVAARAGENDVELAISDTGAGIDAAHSEKVFEPFFTTRRSAGGTGLGLAVTREIAVRHGGHIRVEPGESGGARFVVSLPRPPEVGGP
ncbi:MAG TPA: sensor histidine kinase [Kofleriaceae bacterium]|nr:sensor histidine kinase [Kofleriaceae bacterium]